MKVGMYVMSDNECEHPMEHQYAAYNNAMTNSQKPAPADPDKKTGQASADYYNGITEAEEHSLESMMGMS